MTNHAEIRLVYTSNAVEAFTEAQLEQLAEDSARRNREDGITGHLLFAGGVFLQTLEGNRDAVEGLYTRIERDPRHLWVTQLLHTPIGHRLFETWDMQLCNLDQDDSGLRLELVTVRDFLEDCQSECHEDKAQAIMRFFLKRIHRQARAA